MRCAVLLCCCCSPLCVRSVVSSSGVASGNAGEGGGRTTLHAMQDSREQMGNTAADESGLQRAAKDGSHRAQARTQGDPTAQRTVDVFVDDRLLLAVSPRCVSLFDSCSGILRLRLTCTRVGCRVRPSSCCAWHAPSCAVFLRSGPSAAAAAAESAGRLLLNLCLLPGPPSSCSVHPSPPGRPNGAWEQLRRHASDDGTRTLARLASGRGQPRRSWSSALAVSRTLTRALQLQQNRGSDWGIHGCSSVPGCMRGQRRNGNRTRGRRTEWRTDLVEIPPWLLSPGESAPLSMRGMTHSHCDTQLHGLLRSVTVVGPGHLSVRFSFPLGQSGLGAAAAAAAVAASGQWPHVSGVEPVQLASVRF